jgi:hypothetical protein
MVMSAFAKKVADSRDELIDHFLPVAVPAGFYEGLGQLHPDNWIEKQKDVHCGE